MAKRKKRRGIRLIDIIIIIAIIIIVGIFIKNLAQKAINKENRTETNQTTVQQNQEKNIKLLEDGTKLNTSTQLKEDKKLDNIELKDIQLTYKDGVTNLLCNVQNTSKTKIDMQKVEIVLLDEKENVIYKIPGVIESLQAGETKKFNTSVTADFSNAYNFKIVKK